MSVTAIEVVHAESAQRGQAILAQYAAMLDVGAGPDVQAASLIADVMHAVSVGEVAGFHGEPEGVLEHAREFYGRDVEGKW